MKTRNYTKFLMLLVLFVLNLLVLGCKQSTTSTTANNSNNTSSITDNEIQSNPSSNKQKTSKDRIPLKVKEVYQYIKENGVAKEGYVGGRRFGNYEKHLPTVDNSNKKIQYTEWDVNPKKKGKNRGTERIVIGSDGSAYYTKNHYNSFLKIE